MNVDAIPAGVLELDDRLRIVAANAFANRVLGHTAAPLIGRALADVLMPGGILFYNTQVNPPLALNGRVDEVYLDLRAHDGAGIPVLVNAERTTGAPEGARTVLAFVPMHRRRLFEHELIAARDASEEAARAEREAHERTAVARAQLAGRERLASLGTLAQGIAHEINNPLTVIAADLVDLAEELAVPDRIEPAKLLELVLEARDSVQRIREITRQMGSLVRAEELPRGPLDVNQVVKLVGRMTQVLTRARARVVQELGETPIVDGDTGRLGQVLINLVTNAVQAFGARPAHENEVRIRTRTTEDGGALIEVADNGPGIPPETAARIFEPFFTTKPVGEGTGLGLSISQSLVTSLGGTLSVATELGVGTTFRILLPAIAPADAEAATTNHAASGTRSAAG